MMPADLDLFTPEPPQAAASRRRDPATSKDAARRVGEKLTVLQGRVLTAIRLAGARGLTDRELEELPGFAKLAPSTVRKRRSELLHANPPHIYADHTRNGLTVWRAFA